MVRQVLLLAEAVKTVAGRLPGRTRAIVLAGEGEFLGRLVLQELGDSPERTVVSLAEKLGGPISQAACAHALTVLAAELDFESCDS
jgi:hypothetical protein